MVRRGGGRAWLDEGVRRTGADVDDTGDDTGRGENNGRQRECQAGSWLYGRKRRCFRGCDNEMGHEEGVL